MSEFYRIKGIPGLEGLVVEANARAIADGSPTVFEIITLLPNAVVGDRDVKFPVPPNALFVSHEHLVSTPDPSKEYSTKSPFGTHLYEGRGTKERLEITYTVYDNALSVNVVEKADPKGKGLNRTIYNQNFFAQRAAALEVINDTLLGRLDQDDLVLSLRDIKYLEA